MNRALLTTFGFTVVEARGALQARSADCRVLLAAGHWFACCVAAHLDPRRLCVAAAAWKRAHGHCFCGEPPLRAARTSVCAVAPRAVGRRVLCLLVFPCLASGYPPARLEAPRILHHPPSPTRQPACLQPLSHRHLRLAVLRPSTLQKGCCPGCMKAFSATRRACRCQVNCGIP